MFAEHPLVDLVEPFGALCDRAAEHGVLVGFEFLPYSGVRSIGEVWQVVSAADRPNGGIIVDLWHWFRPEAQVTDLAVHPRFRLHLAATVRRGSRARSADG